MPPSDEKPDADKPKRSQRAAWELYPDAQNADAACLADKIISKAQRKWDKSPLSLTFETLAKANETSRNEMLVMAKSEWNNLNQREQNEFPNTARVALARKLPAAAPRCSTTPPWKRKTSSTFPPASNTRRRSTSWCCWRCWRA